MNLPVFPFREARIDDYGHLSRRMVEAEIFALSEDDIIDGDIDDLHDDVFGKFLIHDVSIDPESVVLPMPSTLLRLENPDDLASGRPVYSWAVQVPFQGNRDLFRIQLDDLDPTSLLDGAVDEVRGVLSIFHDSYLDDDPKDVRRILLAKVAQVVDGLARVRQLVSAKNLENSELIRQVIVRRKQELDRRRAMHDGVGIQLPRRDDASQFRLAARQEPIRVTRRIDASSGRRSPLYLEEASYQAALDVLDHYAVAFERSPSLSTSLTENKIRDILLIGLNAHFCGRATGETFNGLGKTDILIREDDKNVFVGECKVWAGQRRLQQALDQLLGYVTWSDTKAALIVMIRGTNITKKMRSARDSVESHRCHAESLAEVSDRRFDYMLRADSDPDRRVKLALLFIPISR